MDPIYLDYHASTPVDVRVLGAMLPYFEERFGNASSRSHARGFEAQQAVSDARLQVLELLGGRSPDEVVFTSGATESNNLALRGVMQAAGGGHLITTAIEHPCVLETCRALAREGCEVSIVDVSSEGVVSLEAIEAALRPDTRLISVMAVNNEVGTLQPLAEIAQLAQRHGVLFHCDAAQAIGRMALDVQRLGIDLLSLSAHKFYGPKGVGALYVRRWGQPVRLARQTHGGGQERGLRAGTLNVPGIVGLGEAARWIVKEGEDERQRVRALRDHLLLELSRHAPPFRMHGSVERRVGCNLNLAFPGVQADSFLHNVPQLEMSGGAACGSGKAEGSHVLRAMGLSPEQANEALRISLGRMTTSAQVEYAAGELIHTARRLSASLDGN